METCEKIWSREEIKEHVRMGALRGFIFCQKRYPKSPEELWEHLKTCEYCQRMDKEYQNGENHRDERNP
jgi:hypothetical protein